MRHGLPPNLERAALNLTQGARSKFCGRIVFTENRFPLFRTMLYYFGESGLLPDRREAKARELGFAMTSFCAVVRPPDHPARPAGYASLDPFWRTRGYAPVEGLVGQFERKDLGDGAETSHPMQFWVKSLDRHCTALAKASRSARVRYRSSIERIAIGAPSLASRDRNPSARVDLPLPRALHSRITSSRSSRSASARAATSASCAIASAPRSAACRSCARPCRRSRIASPDRR